MTDATVRERLCERYKALEQIQFLHAEGGWNKRRGWGGPHMVRVLGAREVPDPSQPEDMQRDLLFFGQTPEEAESKALTALVGPPQRVLP